ncbi:MAG: hypothetical protein WCH31_09775 [Actinomycetes bacterium]
MLITKIVPRPVRAHALASLLVAALVLGGGLRLIPTDSAAATPAGGASTSCAS